MRALLLILLVCISVFSTSAQTIVTIESRFGDMELELYDNDKPITVSNFLKYATSDRFRDLLLQRWEPGFVIQAGQWQVTPDGAEIDPVPVFGEIKNEANDGPFYKNTYGTIAMARRPGAINSASSQWFINLTNSPHLDTTDEGFTVFGKVITGTNILNLFHPPQPANGIYRRPDTIPVTSTRSAANDLYLGDLILLNFTARRDVGLRIAKGPGLRWLMWNSVANVTNSLEWSTNSPVSWQTLTNFVGNGQPVTITDRRPGAANWMYRVTVKY